MSLHCSDCTILIATLVVLGLVMAVPFFFSPVDTVWQYFHITFTMWALSAWFQVTLLISACQWIKDHPESQPEQTKETLRASLLVFVTASILVMSTLLVIIADYDNAGSIPVGAGLLFLTAVLIAVHWRFSCVYYK